MADALLGIVIENLGHFVRDEFGSFLGVGEFTEKLFYNLIAIRAVIQDAEEKQITSRVVKDWLQKMADAAYVLEDILDECSITSKAHGENKWITSFHLMNILARRNIGKRMKEVAKRIDDIAEERIKFGFQPVGVTEEHQRGDDEWRQTISAVTEPKVYGRDKDKEQIVEFLLNASDSEELSVCSIVGVGGQGKTTLAQIVYNDERVNTHFDLKIWVCVSDDFSLMKILESIIENTIGKKPDLLSLESRQKKVQEILQNKRYLLVLDDVWSEDQEKWNKLKSLLQHGKKGASILVTTRLDIVASIMGTNAHNLGRLSDDDIWSLFKQHAFGANREERAELVEIGQQLVRKCVGSPLAAKVLGSLLHFKSDEHQWISVLESEFWNLPQVDRIMSALTLSYFNLKLSLRPCITFCAVFPKDFEMEKEELIQLWMANGLVTSRGKLQMEHVGNEVWNELYQRSFFQEVKSDFLGNITFKMHDLVHDLAKSVIGEECVSSKAESLTNLSSRVHHVSCFDTKRKFDYNMIPFKKVESLRTFLELKPTYRCSDALLSIIPLRALSTSSRQLSPLKNLIHLRYLKLEGSNITTLPASLCKLQKLQTLKLEYCRSFSSFPKQFKKLQNLRHVMIQCCPLKSTPFRIGELTSLQTLTNFIVGSKIGFGLAELHNLQLGGKLYIKGLENVSNEDDAGEANLIGKKDLNSLYLSWGDDANSQVGSVDAERVLEALEPHSGLKHVGVNGYGGTNFPHWMKNTSILKGLVRIILSDCKNCRQLPPFGKLPCLNILFVSGMNDLKYIDDDLYEPATEKAFMSLKELTLCDLPNLERVLEVEGVEMLPQLLELDIRNVPKLTLPPLPSVKSLSAEGGNEELLKSIVNNSNLKSLSISKFARLRELPGTFELGTLSALEDLEIKFCDEMESLSEQLLQGLSSLERLQINDCPQFVFPDNKNSLTSLRQLVVWKCNENILDGIEGIPSLQSLCLFGFDSLTSLPDSLGAMTSLQVLEIDNFPKLSSLPDNFQQLQNLKYLVIEDCPMLEKRCKRGIGEDWHKIAHIPQLYWRSDVEPTKPTICGNLI